MAQETQGLDGVMNPEEQLACGVDRLTQPQRDRLFKWGLRMFGLGRAIVGSIEDVKYSGRLVILDDGSRWEVEDIDASTAEIWQYLDDVIVFEDIMYNLEGCEKVEVAEDL